MQRIEGISPVARKPIMFRAMNRSFDVQAKDETAVISIYEDIGYFGVTAQDMRRQLDAITAPNIELRINSPGGDVFDGIAIYNDLLEHPAKVSVKITGLAASAASLIALAGDEVHMAENAFYMIHNAWAIALGNRHTMQEMHDMLSRIDASLIQTYMARSGNDQDQIMQWMDEETWFSAEEAKDAGFVTAISKTENPKALFDLSAYSNVPGRLKRQIEAGLRDAGFSHREAKAAMSEGFPQRDAGSKPRDGDAVPTNYQQIANLIRGIYP